MNAKRYLAIVVAAAAVTGCTQDSWMGYRKHVTLEFEEHDETINWKNQEKAALEKYAKAEEEGRYQVPVSVAMQNVAKDPSLLEPLIELKTDLSGMTLAQQGEQYFKIKYACAGCHSMQGQRLVGPALNNRWGTVALLEGDEEVPFNDEYFKESVLYSRKKIARGYPPAMPQFRGGELVISDEEYEAIKAYVMTYQ